VGVEKALGPLERGAPPAGPPKRFDGKDFALLRQ
jgi:hypothetical protein